MKTGKEVLKEDKALLYSHTSGVPIFLPPGNLVRHFIIETLFRYKISFFGGGSRSSLSFSFFLTAAST